MHMYTFVSCENSTALCIWGHVAPHSLHCPQLKYSPRRRHPWCLAVRLKVESAKRFAIMIRALLWQWHRIYMKPAENAMFWTTCTRRTACRASGDGTSPPPVIKGSNPIRSIGLYLQLIYSPCFVCRVEANASGTAVLLSFF